MGEPIRGTIFNIQKFSINDGPGIRTLVFFKGCPLACGWCSNPESQEPRLQIMWEPKECRHCQTCMRSCPSKAIEHVDGSIVIDHKKCSGSEGCSARRLCVEQCPAHALKSEGEHRSVEEIMRVIMQDEPFYAESGGGVTLSGGEPMMQPEFALELLRALKSKRIHTAIETTGFAPTEVFDRLIDWIDLLLFDMKHWDEARHRAATRVSNEPILRNMRNAIELGKEVLPRLPVIPNYNDSLEDARGFVRRLKYVGASRVQLLPFHQFGENKYRMLGRAYAFEGVRSLHAEDLTEFQKVFADAGIDAFF